jgi:hypothetical protein
MTFRSSAAIAPATASAAEPAQMAVKAGLLYVSCEEPGTRRKRAGKGYYYLTRTNRRLTSASELRRIASLAARVPQRLDLCEPAGPFAGDRRDFRTLAATVRAMGLIAAVPRDSRTSKSATRRAIAGAEESSSL